MLSASNNPPDQIRLNSTVVLQQARIEPVDVVISVIGMPRMDRYELARRLREDMGLKGVVLVALTGYGRETDKRQ